ncbi:MAG: peptidylprolyl isomerase [Alcanivoracaceae bacterium]
MNRRLITASWEMFDDQGNCLERSDDRSLMRYSEGDNTLFPALADALFNIEAGEERTVRLEPEQAHGPHRENLVFEVVNSHLPEGSRPYPGMTFAPGGQQGKFQLTVLEVLEDRVRVDGNHRYAGMAITFRVKAVSISTSFPPIVIRQV